MNECRLCPRNCSVDRSMKPGFCGSDDNIHVSAWNLHFGEEPPITGRLGSGTVFFTYCSLQCRFCQNYPISCLGHGEEIPENRLKDIFLDLQSRGAHNINLVSAAHYSDKLVDILEKIKGRELKIPVVYNSSGYESIDTLKRYKGLVDIYLPDAKYSDTDLAYYLSSAADYVEVNRAALSEMKRQAGFLKKDDKGIAKKGLIIRHLVLPGEIKNTKGVLEYISSEIGNECTLSLMSQYHPAHKTVNDRRYGRRLEEDEYLEAVSIADELGFEDCFCQEL